VKRTLLISEHLFFCRFESLYKQGFPDRALNALIPLNLQHWTMFASVNIAYDNEILDLLEKAHCESIPDRLRVGESRFSEIVNKKQNNPVKYRELLKIGCQGNLCGWFVHIRI
jgi:hypothetical protein